MFPRQEQVRECRGDLQQMDVLGQAAVPNLGEAKLQLHHREHVLDSGSDLGLGPVLHPLNLVDGALVPVALVGEVLSFRRKDRKQVFLAPISLIAVDPPFLAMQQFRKYPGVMDIGCSCFDSVNELRRLCLFLTPMFQ